MRKSPRRRTLRRRVDRAERRIAEIARHARPQPVPVDKMELRTLRVLVWAYAQNFGGLTVSGAVGNCAGVADTSIGQYVPEADTYVVLGRVRTPFPPEAMGGLLVMAARHAAATRDPSDAFDLADACEVAVRQGGIDPARATAAAAEIAGALAHGFRPVGILAMSDPLSFHTQMRRALGLLKRTLSARDLAAVEDVERRNDLRVDAMRAP